MKTELIPASELKVCDQFYLDGHLFTVHEVSPSFHGHNFICVNFNDIGSELWLLKSAVILVVVKEPELPTEDGSFIYNVVPKNGFRFLDAKFVRNGDYFFGNGLTIIHFSDIIDFTLEP